MSENILRPALDQALRELGVSVRRVDLVHDDGHAQDPFGVTATVQFDPDGEGGASWAVAMYGAQIASTMTLANALDEAAAAMIVRADHDRRRVTFTHELNAERDRAAAARRAAREGTAR